MTGRLPSAPWIRTLGLFSVVFLAYAAGALLSLKAFGASELGPAFFPAAGVTVAAMLMTRRAQWPAVIAAIVLGETAVDVSAGYAPLAIAGYVLANTVEPLVGASVVLAWCKGVPDLRRRRELLIFVAGACLAGPMLGGLIGGGTVAWQFGTWWPGAALRWFASDAIGVLVVAAPILLWPRQSNILRERPVETVGILGTTAALSWLAIWTGLQPSLLILPVLAWAALRLDVLGAALAGAAAALTANVRGASGLSLFGDLQWSTSGRLALVQAVIAINVLLAMLIAQESSARREAARERAVEQQERRRLQTLARLAQQLSAALTPQDVGRVLETQLVRDIGATGVNLALAASDGRLERVGVARHPTPLVSDLGDGVVSWPLTTGAETIGLLSLARSEPQPLNAAQQAYMSAVATMVGQALSRAKSYTDQHARAAMLRSAAHPTAPVDAVGLEYRAFYQPAEEAPGLGGDWYSVMPLAAERTYLSVGDVIGHGLMAVEDMAQLRSAGNAYAHQGLRPAQLLAELNRFAGSQIRGEFATNLVAVFDSQSHSLSYSSAGHPPALLRRAETGEVIRLSDARGPVLGPFDDAVYSEVTVPIGSGDILVMYTDGLVEHHETNVQAGIAHLEQAVAQWPPEALLDCEALAGNVAPRPYTDDICLLVARFGTDGGVDRLLA